MNENDIQLYTYKQLSNIYNYVEEIIDSLPDKALNELLSGYQNDTDALIEELTRQTHFVINHNASKVDSESLGYLKELEYAFDYQLKKLSLNYFKATVLNNFEMGWRNFEWGNMMQLYPWSAYLAQRGSGKCFGKDTEVVMYDGTLKKIQNIRVGDKLMGVDNTPRTVLSLHSGEDELFQIKRQNKSYYIVNKSHNLVFCNKFEKRTWLVTPVEKFLNKFWQSYEWYGIHKDKDEIKYHLLYKPKSIGVGEYYGFSCDKDRLFMLKDGTIVHNSYEFCYAAPLWKLYSYDPPKFLTQDTLDNKNRKWTIMVTNESRLVNIHISKITEEINNNDILREKLNKRGGALGKETVITDTGSRLDARSFGSQIRGTHPGNFFVDDFVSRSALYSAEQREKFHDVFYSEIIPALEPGGSLIVSGCVSPNSIVLTKNGLRYIGDLCPENYEQDKKIIPFKENVIGKNSFNKTSHYWCNGVSDNYKIKTRFGFNLEGSDIHPVLIMGKDGLMKWKKMPELNKGDFVALRLGTGFGDKRKVSTEGFHHSKKNIATTINVDAYLNKDWLYFFGLWIADGCFDKTKSGFTITKNNKGIRNFVLSGFNNTKFKPRKNDEIKMDFYSVELKSLFDAIGCNVVKAKYKTVPKKIFESDEESLKYFLQGLFDGDGCMSVDKKGFSTINLSSISYELIRQVQIILLHFGICSYVQNRGVGISKKVIGKNDLYALNISGFDVNLFVEKIGFRFSGKIKPLNKSNDRMSRFKGVPYQSEIFKKVRKEKGRICRGTKIGGLNSQSLYNKVSSKEVLKECLQFFINNGASGEYTEIAKKNLYNDYIFLPIVSIEKTKGYTVDFVIPNDHSFLSNGIISHNTPFHENDIYGDLKKDHRFKVFEYPAIFPNGQILAPDRFSFKKLMDIKKTLGSILFSREYLVTPISDGSSLFPWEFLNKSFIGMETVNFVTNRDSYAFKLNKIVVGCDFAKSATVGADYTAYTVWGVDGDENYYLLYAWRKRGASTNEQVNKILQLNHQFTPNKIICEANGFQSLIADEVRRRGLKNVEDFTTTGNKKKSDYEGLPSLSAFFERGKIKIPYNAGETRDLAMTICSEFNSITFDSDKGKLESASGHDDLVLSSWFALYYLIENKVNPSIYYV